MIVYMSYLKFVTQTERMPASAAARHATGTTSETCFLKSIQSYSKQKLKSQYHFFFCLLVLSHMMVFLQFDLHPLKQSYLLIIYTYCFYFKSTRGISHTTKSALIEFSHSVSDVKI